MAQGTAANLQGSRGAVLFCEAVPVGTVICEIKPEERYTKRLEQAKPVLDALLAWANDLIPRTAPKSALGKALHYLKEQWPYLVRYLEDGRLELSNNRAERSIKPFVMGRNYVLFPLRNGEGKRLGPVPISALAPAKCAGSKRNR
ncbi:transposase [Oscillibacter sp. MCC667]|nr:transposase [Oscillibacter sp. MCC667]